MVSVFLLAIVVIGAYVVVLAGSTAYELTGLDKQTARFQALSAFTGTGFTTRISERVVGHPLRRRITATLIILGYAGTATVVASLVATVGQETYLDSLINILIMVVIALGLWALLRRLGPRFLGDVIRRYLAPRISSDRVSRTELLLYRDNFGITRIEVPAGSRVIGRSLRELNLRAWRIQILAVEEGDGVHAIPDPDWTFESGQHLIVYGDRRRIQAAFGPSPSAE